MTKTGEAAKPPTDLDDHAENFVEWVKANGRQATLIGIALVVIVAGGILWRSSTEKKEANAGKSLSEAQRSFTAGNLALAQSDLQKLVQRYNGTVAADQGRLLLAQVYYDQNKVADGLKALDGMNATGPFKASFHAIRAAGLEQSGKGAEAGAEYVRAADAAVTESDKGQYRSDAARALNLAGKKDEALKIWKEMAADENNPFNAEAKLRIGELTAVPAKG
jgi:predicted negative regulator of RcsB-dependent stress response